MQQGNKIQKSLRSEFKNIIEQRTVFKNSKTINKYFE